MAGNFNPGNMQKMMKQVQKMQQDMLKMQEEIGAREVEGTAGSGLVTITMTGNQEVKGVVVKPEAIDSDDPEMLQDLLVVAFNDALTKAKDMMAGEMGKITGGMNIPGLF